MSGPSLVSLMSMVLQALYRLVSPWWLSLTFRVAVAAIGEAAAGVATVYGVSDVADAADGWCGSVCGRSVACVRGRVAGDAVGEGVASDEPGDVVGEGGVGGAFAVIAAGDGVVDGVLCDALVARVLLLMVPGLVASGAGGCRWRR